MANVKNKQQDTMASIDTAKAMVDKVLAITQIMSASDTPSFTFATNPIGFILQLLEHVGVKYEDLLRFLTDFLTYTLPVLEISVKTVLLTNLKNMISCSVDPRIPDKYRKRLHCNEAFVNDYGIDISVESIDFMDKLSENPLSDFGKEMYFGLEGIDDVYKFARAEDFDAFLWFVIHKGKFPTASNITDMSAFTDSIHGVEATKVTPTDGTLLDVLDVSFDASSASTIMLGNTFTYSGSTGVTSMCIDRKYDDKNNIVNNTIIPVSSDICSVNWYIRRRDQLTKNLGFGKKTFDGRDFSKERAICNLQYIDASSSDASPASGLVNNKIKLTILPKPYIHIPQVDKGEKPWGFIPLLFDSNGDYNLNGKYSISPTDVKESYPNNETFFNIQLKKGSTYTNAIRVDKKSGKVLEIVNRDLLIKKLTECYKGLTVYEFNYDYVMSLKLFDPKVMAATLIDTLVNTRLGLNLAIEKKHQDATEEIKEIIKNIINQDESLADSCYFTFDNSKYDALLRKSEEKRAKQYNFGNTTNKSGTFENVAEILAEYDNAATLEQQINVINRALTQASVNISDGVDEAEKYGVKFGFVTDLVENLMLAVVNSVLTPKVLMLLEVNRQIMGGSWKAFTMKDLLVSMSNIIVGLVREVRDLVIQELLKFVLKQLEPLIQALESIIVREQIENYTELINDIIRNCPTIWFRFGNLNQETKLDTVDYADIDVSSLKKDITPNNNC